MEKSYIRSLIVRITGARFPGESKDEWLYRGSGYARIGYSSFRAAWYGQYIGPNIYISKNTREKLERAAKHACKPHYLITIVEHQIRIWEADPNPELYRPYIDAAREFVGTLTVQPEDVSAGNGDGEIAGAATAAAAT